VPERGTIEVDRRAVGCGSARTAEEVGDVDTRTETQPRTRTWIKAGIVAVVAAAILAFAYVAIGPRSVAGEVDADGRLEVTVEGYAFDIDTWRVPVEEPFTLVVVNLDEVSHPLSFGRELVHEGAGRLPTGFAEDLLEGLDPAVAPATALTRDDDGTTTLQVPGGRTVTMQVTLPADRAGTWEAGCFLGGGCHRVAGLDATLEVGG
jgi:hypothetical protein